MLDDFITTWTMAKEGEPLRLLLFLPLRLPLLLLFAIRLCEAQTRYRALAVYAVYVPVRFDCMLMHMPRANPKSIQELEAQKKAIRDAAAAEVAAIRKATAAKVAALKASERRLRALDIREQKRRDNHAKILVGVAMIHQCQISEASATKFKGMLEEFYSDSPERLKNALYGLSLVVKKPNSDQEQD